MSELALTPKEINLMKFIGTKEVVAEQYRHLTDEQKCRQTEHSFGRIEGKYVIYRGEPTEENGITYLNVEQYLKSLS